MPANNFTFLWVSLALTGMAMLIHYWHLITSRKEPPVPNEEDTI
ncbi:hypothetical protein [Niastella yeongjuensis]|nr:hypothetical protein [Niastella yeongjuensis]SEP00620.1 hypothetical protein SAMN05660816_04150 [Niastella yeongjuensis]